MPNLKDAWDTTGDLFTQIEGQARNEQGQDIHLAPDDGINTATDLLSCAELVQPNDVKYTSHAIFNNIHNPQTALYFDFNQPVINGIQYDVPLFLPLKNAQGELKQVAVMQWDKRTSIEPPHKPLAFAQWGEYSKDSPIIVTYELDTAFKMANCGYAVALAVFHEKLSNTIKTDLKEAECNIIKSVCNQLNKAGYHRLYIVSYPTIYPKVHDALQQALAALNVRFIDADGIGHLGFANEWEIKELIDDTLKNQQTVKPIPKGHLAHPMQLNGGCFDVLPTGVMYTKKDGKNGDEKTVFISSPVIVLAKTRDNTSNDWGRLLQWNDDAGVTHTWAVSMELFQTDGAELRKALANQGVTIASGSYERRLFQTYLMNYPVEQRALCVNRVGWHEDQYVLPCEVIGQNADNEIVVYQSTNNANNKYTSKGTLQEWQQHIAKRAEHHKFLALAICTAFTGQLLEPLNQSGKGIHFKGESSKGKSTAIFTACTVWGNPESYHHTWRNTSNALEQTAFTHNDGLLVLDEIGEIPNPKELGSIVYMLINGSGKGRMNKSLTLRDTNRWRLVFLSSGEKTLSELMGEAGQKAKLGQEIRLINIDIDQSQYAIFDQVDFADDAAKQAVLLNADIKRFYGTAGKAWLEYLTQDKLKHASNAKALIEQYSQILIGSHTQGHIVRVANYFAIVAASGELATQAGITAWQQGTAFNAVQAVFNHWISEFDQVGDYEDREILAHVKAFFALHGSSRFEHIEQNIIRNTAGDPITPRINNRVGYWKQEHDSKKYLVYPELFKSEICKGFDHKRVARALKSHGWLDHNANENMKSERIPDADKPQRMYVFNQNMWEWSDSEKTTRNTRNSRNNLEPQGFDLLRNENTQHVTTEKHVTKPDTEQKGCYVKSAVTDSENQPRNNTEAIQDKAVTCVTAVTCQKTPIPEKRNKPKDDLNDLQGSFLL